LKKELKRSTPDPDSNGSCDIVMQENGSLQHGLSEHILTSVNSEEIDLPRWIPSYREELKTVVLSSNDICKNIRRLALPMAWDDFKFLKHELKFGVT